MRGFSGYPQDLRPCLSSSTLPSSPLDPRFINYKKQQFLPSLSGKDIHSTYSTWCVRDFMSSVPSLFVFQSGERGMWRVWTHKYYLSCQTHLGTSISWRYVEYDRYCFDNDTPVWTRPHHEDRGDTVGEETGTDEDCKEGRGVTEC